MDGFFVAKFKVDKRGKQSQSNDVTEDVPPQMMINEYGEVVVEDAGKSAFDESADQAYIAGTSPPSYAMQHKRMRAGSKRKHLLKTKGIKLVPKVNGGKNAETVTGSGHIKVSKGEKMAEKRRVK